jgi:hypothetical protein
MVFENNRCGRVVYSRFGLIPLHQRRFLVLEIAIVGFEPANPMRLPMMNDRFHDFPD